MENFLLKNRQSQKIAFATVIIITEIEILFLSKLLMVFAVLICLNELNVRSVTHLQNLFSVTLSHQKLGFTREVQVVGIGRTPLRTDIPAIRDTARDEPQHFIEFHVLLQIGRAHV